MKTTRKGFTLIELIVVIAIIGVLAAILVPAMLGYVKKSKIQAANADAKTMLTIANTALEEADEIGAQTPGDGWLNCNGLTTTTNDGDITDAATLVAAMGEYSDTAKSTKFCVCIKSGAAVATVAKSGKYYGTYPASLTNKTYNKAANSTDYTKGGLGASPTMADAIAHAANVYNQSHTDTNAQISTSITGGNNP